uniref:Uncharacterized protein n=1 Tax=Arundo donax TaxID=35708 RepID=A0A0A9FKT3_ARUDO
MVGYGHCPGHLGGLEILRQRFPQAPTWGQAGFHGGGSVTAVPSRDNQVNTMMGLIGASGPSGLTCECRVPNGPSPECKSRI